MKRVLSDLKIGESLQGRVEEILSDVEILICFQGDLLRVHNETHHQLKVGDAVTVMVRAIDPLRFQMLPDRVEQRRKGQLNLSV